MNFSRTLTAMIGCATALAACSDSSEPNGNGGATIATIAVTASPTDLERTVTTQAAAVARDASNAVVANPTLGWSSSNTSVATVSGSGLVSALSRGSTRITAASGSVSGYVDLTVFVRYGFIAAGTDFACNVGSIGLVHCWGGNTRGQFGNGGSANSTTPVTASGSVRLTKLSAGGNTICGLTAAGAAYCSGSNSSGQLGVGAAGDRNTLGAVTGGLTFTAISVGEVHTCALTTAGAAYCWGDNFDGQLGNGTTNNSNAPVQVLGGLTFSKIHAGYQSTCAVTADNRGFCWGQDASGQLGDGGVITNNTTDKKLQPSQVDGGAIWSSIAPSGSSTCGITTAGLARCWGNAGTGILGNGSITPTSSPAAAVTGALTFRSINVSMTLFACGLTTTNEAYCWGANGDGQLGAANPIDLSTTPIRAGGTLTFSDLSVSQSGTHVCGVSVDLMTVHCWGKNASGQMGNGTTSAARNPAATVVTGQSPSGE